MLYNDEEATNSEDIYGEGLEHPNVQSVLFQRPMWTITQAKRWLKRHDFKKYDVDIKENHYRFRQIEPEPQFTYITEEADNGVQFIIITNRPKGKGIHNKYNMPRHYETSDSDSSDSEDEIIRDMGKLEHRIKKHHEVKGGKLNIVKSFKKLGSTIKQGFEPVAHYITAKKGGLASDLLHQGVPIVTGALAGAAGDMLGGPLAGVVAGETGSRLASSATDALGKKIGVGLGKGDLIHIDVASHNAKGPKASSQMKGDGLKKRRGRPSKSSVLQLIEAHREREAKDFMKDMRKLQKHVMQEKGIVEKAPKYSKKFEEEEEGEGIHAKMARLRAMRKPKK